MMGPVEKQIDIDRHLYELRDVGYTVVNGLLNSGEISQLQAEVDREIERVRNNPWDPGDKAPSHPEDKEIERFIRRSYPACPEAEYARIMRLIRHTRHENFDTPFPFPIERVLKIFFIDRPSKMAERLPICMSWLQKRQSLLVLQKIQFCYN